jgi:hypothetical protein
MTSLPLRLFVRVVRRHGKIHRLPYAVRLEIDRRISKGIPPHSILVWVNAQPAVQEILWRHYRGLPVDLENLKSWRRRGRADLRHVRWLAPRAGKKRGSKAKIERFPEPIRIAVNKRLLDGQSGRQILAWLNSRPAVRRLLAGQFGGHPVNHENLSHYRHHGFSEWLATEIQPRGHA